MEGRGRFAALIGAFSAALFLALVICASGVLSLLTDSDVVVQQHGGPLVAPLMFALATAVVFVLVGTTGARRGHRIVAPAVGIGLAAYLLFLVTGAVAEIFDTGRPIVGLLFLGENALTPYAIALAIIGAVVALCALLLLSVRDAGGASTTPRWPWERRDPPES
jgi:hypothetical protein